MEWHKNPIKPIHPIKPYKAYKAIYPPIKPFLNHYNIIPELSPDNRAPADEDAVEHPNCHPYHEPKCQ